MEKTFKETLKDANAGFKADMAKQSDKSQERDVKIDAALNDPTQPISKWWVRLLISVLVVGLVAWLIKTIF